MNKPLIVLQISDLHILAETEETLYGVNTEHSFQQLLKQAHTLHGKVDLVLVTGDLAQHPCQASYHRIYKALEKYHTQTVCLPGNHDDLLLMNQLINGEQVNCRKQIQFNDWQIISLNSKKPASQAGYLSKNELDYLTEALDKQADLNTLIAVHHHPVPINSRWMDGMMIENSGDLFLLLKQHPQVKAIICGHIHQDFNFQKQGIQILGVPSSCFQFEPHCTQFTIDNKSSGYRLLKLYPNGLIQSNIYRAENV